MTVETSAAPPAAAGQVPPRAWTTEDFDFELPPELVAQQPAAERSASRLLDGTCTAPVDRIFRELPDLLDPGDLVVFNDTRVIKARLFGRKSSGGAVELLVERLCPGQEVLAHLRASKSPKAGARLLLADGAFEAEVLGREGPDGALFRLRLPEDPLALLERHGHVPLPPYIARADTPADEARYQSVLAQRPGAVAAPTASLHFDAALLQALQAAGVERCTLTLHVGAGTFQPVRSDDLSAHRMHAEWFEIPAGTVAAVQAARAWRPRGGGRHHGAARARIGGAFRRAAADRRRDRHLHHPRLRVPRRRPPGHELPPSAQHAADARRRFRRPRARDGAVPARGRGALPLLQLRRRDVARARRGADPANRGLTCGSGSGTV